MNTHDNPSDILTKVLSMSEKRWEFPRMLQHHIIGSFPEETAVAQCCYDCWYQKLYDEYLRIRMQTMEYVVISISLWVLAS